MKSESVPYAQPGGEDPPECFSGFVGVDNTCSDLHTRLTVDVADFPGLLRIVSWVLNGMEIRVKHATLLASNDGRAIDTFFLTDWEGKKLSDKDSDLLKDRMQEFVVSCTPKCAQPTEWACGSLTVSNRAHPVHTELRVRGEPSRHGFLLELASVITGSGALIHEAHVQGSVLQAEAEAPPASSIDAAAELLISEPRAVAPLDHDFNKGRYFVFLLSSRAGEKLDAARVTALIHMYEMLTSGRAMPLRVPSLETYQVMSACD